MRELKDCKAEIFRRSKNRINRRRRNISRTLAFCVPLFLAATVWSVTLLPTVIYDGINEINGGTYGDNAGGIMDGGNGYQLGAVSSAELSGSSESVPAGEVSDTKPFESEFDTSNADNDIKAESSASNSSETPETDESSDKPDDPVKKPDPLDNFSFSLNWGDAGTSYYNSKTGRLVKSADSAVESVDGITTYKLTYEQKLKIYELISALDVASYPDSYNPYGESPDESFDGLAHPESVPITLILSVSCDNTDKTITANNICNYESDDSKGQEFLSVCKAIEEILTRTEEWNALP